MPLSLTREQDAAVKRLQAMLEAGREPLVDHDLIAESSTVLAAGGNAGTPISVRPYENGVIVSLKGQAYDPAGGAEVDTMAERMHEKYLGVLLNIAQRPKTNDLYEPMYTLVPRRVLWVVAQNDLISVTFKHLATTASSIASLHGRLSFGFVPFSQLGV